MAPESNALLQPSHLRHRLCHLVAIGPFFSSMIPTTLSQPGHNLVMPNFGRGLDRELNSADGLTSFSADLETTIGITDRGSGTTLVVRVTVSDTNLVSAQALQYANLAISWYMEEGARWWLQLVQEKH
jgi:hypothetical protein